MSDSVSGTTKLGASVSSLEDAALQKRFSALFDEGQGENARRAFVAFCNSRGYHPAEIKLLCGANLFERMDRMIQKQQALLEEQKIANQWMIAELRRLGGGKPVFPPKPKNAAAAAAFQRLALQKFGPSRGAHTVAMSKFGITKSQFKRFLCGIDVSEVLLNSLEEVPDWSTGALKPSVRRKVSKNHRLIELEHRFAHIPKPRKFSRAKSSMTSTELQNIGQSWFGDDWTGPLAQFIGYNIDHIKMFLEGRADRYITEATASYINCIQGELSAQGGFNGIALTSKPLTKSRSNPRRATQSGSPNEEEQGDD